MSTRCLDKAEGVESPRAHAMLSRRSQAEPKSREWVSARTVVLPAIDPEQSLNLSCDIFLIFFWCFLMLLFNKPTPRLRVEDTSSPNQAVLTGLPREAPIPSPSKKY